MRCIPEDNLQQREGRNLLPQLQDEDTELSSIQGIQQFLRRLLSEISNGCTFGHTKKRGKQCHNKPFGCLHYVGNGPGTAINSLFGLNIIDVYDYCSLSTKYREIYSNLYGMDVQLHTASEGTERNALIKIAQEKRGIMAKFIENLLVICDGKA